MLCAMGKGRESGNKFSPLLMGQPAGTWGILQTRKKRLQDSQTLGSSALFHGQDNASPPFQLKPSTAALHQSCTRQVPWRQASLRCTGISPLNEPPGGKKGGEGESGLIPAGQVRWAVVGGE